MDSSLPLSANRAEEKSDEAWMDYIIPPSFDKLELRNTGQSRVIVGGRGSGKTMLLKYLSYQSEFSAQHDVLDSSCIKHVGLYLRADTIFSKALSGAFFSEQEWNSVFQHYIVCMVLHEISVSLRYIANSAYDQFSNEDFLNSSISDIANSYDSELPLEFSQLEGYFYRKNIEFDSWASNLFQETERPKFYSISFLKVFIDELRKSNVGLSGIQFFVYVDEYETFLQYQKRMLNTFIKHGQRPLVFHFAMKRFVIEEDQSTLGDQNIQEVHDYRHTDIEDLYSKDYGAFVAEIVLYELSKSDKSIQIDSELIKDTKRLGERRISSYRDAIRKDIVKYFPNYSEMELAEIAFGDESIANKIYGEIERALKKRGLRSAEGEVFRSIGDKKAVLIAPILLHRDTLDFQDLKSLYESFADNKSGRLVDLIQNNFVASLLFFYQKYSDKPCPLYSGFDRFLTISDQNIRFMMELCHNSILQNDIADGNGYECNWKSMAIGAKVTSEKFFLETRKCGVYGFKLHELVKRLGAVFQVAQSRPTQSENEINHFGIKDGGDSALSEEANKLIVEAIKHSILTVRRETKVKKSEYYAEDYVLSPVFAPYFKISYRKKRKLEISLEDFNTIMSGDSYKFNEFIRLLKRKWVEEESLSSSVGNLSGQGRLEL